jgi:hypothetical protein
MPYKDYYLSKKLIREGIETASINFSCAPGKFRHLNIKSTLYMLHFVFRPAPPNSLRCCPRSWRGSGSRSGWSRNRFYESPIFSAENFSDKFLRQNFGQIVPAKFRTNFHSKTTDINISDHNIGL